MPLEALKLKRLVNDWVSGKWAVHFPSPLPTRHPMPPPSFISSSGSAPDPFLSHLSFKSGKKDFVFLLAVRWTNRRTVHRIRESAGLLQIPLVNTRVKQIHGPDVERCGAWMNLLEAREGNRQRSNRPASSGQKAISTNRAQSTRRSASTAHKL